MDARLAVVYACERELLPLLCQLAHDSIAARSPDTIGLRTSTNVLLRRELLAEVAADFGRAQVRLAERRRSVHNGVGIQRGDGLSVAFWPGLRPGIGPASGGRRASTTPTLSIR